MRAAGDGLPSAPTDWAYRLHRRRLRHAIDLRSATVSIAAGNRVERHVRSRRPRAWSEGVGIWQLIGPSAVYDCRIRDNVRRGRHGGDVQPPSERRWLPGSGAHRSRFRRHSSVRVHNRTNTTREHYPHAAFLNQPPSDISHSGGRRRSGGFSGAPKPNPHVVGNRAPNI